MTVLALQLFDEELVRMTFIVGIAVSVMFYERTHTTTGSLVIPGYIGAQLLNPVALLATAINAGVTFVLVSRVLPRYAAVFGRARFVANIVVSVVLTLLLGPALSFVTGPTLPLLDTIGYVIPALIAYDMNRQGSKKTMVAVGLSGALAALPALLIVAVAPGVVDKALPVATGLLAVGDVWFPIVALISTGVSATLYNVHGLRSGGFVGPMYLGLAAVHPMQLLYFVATAVFVWLCVHHGLKRVLILFGRRKFAVMLMFGSLTSWAILSLVESVHPTLLGIGGLPIAALFIPALLANDMERTSPLEVSIGGLIAGTMTLSLTIVLASLVDGLAMEPWAGPALVVATAALLWPRVSARWSPPLPTADAPASNETSIPFAG